MDKKYDGFSLEAYTKAIAILNIAIFVSLLIFWGLFTYFSPKQEFSEAEKRALATFPEFSTEALFSGEYTSSLSLYYADNFAMRDFFVALGAEFESARGYSKDDVRLYQGASSEATPPPPSSSESPSAEDSSDTTSSTAPSEAPTEPEPEGQQLGATFIYDGRGLAIYGGDPTIGKWYADTIDTFIPLLGEDVTIYNMVVPTSIEFYLPERYSDISHPQEPAIEHIYDNLDEAIIAVDAYSALEAHKDEYIYFNTDHHWTALGAYYAYTAFAESAGFDAIPLSELESTRIENFIGTLYAWTQDQSLLENPDYVDYYTIDTPHTVEMYLKNQPYYPYASSLYAHGVQGSNAYMIFIHGDQPMMKITTENKNGKSIMVIKESYGNAFVPLLVNHYEEVYVVDGRYFQLALVPFIQQNEIDELLFLNNIMAAYTPYNIQRFETMKYQVFVPPEPDPPAEEDGELSEATDGESNENAEVSSEDGEAEEEKEPVYRGGRLVVDEDEESEEEQEESEN